MIAIVDYGMGNLGSIRNMLRRIGVRSTISGDADEIARADEDLLARRRPLRRGDARDRRARSPRRCSTRRRCEERVPTLGICLGMQLMTRGSDEGPSRRTRLDSGRCPPIPGRRSLKVPHMGWNASDVARERALTDGLPRTPRFYFVHSYYVTD